MVDTSTNNIKQLNLSNIEYDIFYQNAQFIKEIKIANSIDSIVTE
jgi:hypothetical protein